MPLEQRTLSKKKETEQGETAELPPFASQTYGELNLKASFTSALLTGRHEPGEHDKLSSGINR